MSIDEEVDSSIDFIKICSVVDFFISKNIEIPEEILESNGIKNHSKPVICAIRNLFPSANDLASCRKFYLKTALFWNVFQALGILITIPHIEKR